MTILLAADTILPPQYRFLRQRTASSAWDILPSMRTAGGYILDELSRRALPGFGHMVFHYNMGWIDGNTPGITYGTNLVDGSESDVINMAGQIVRLQMAPGAADQSAAPVWKTVWVGVVEHQTTEIGPGGDYLTGVRKFYCQDLFCSFASKARVDHSSLYVAADATLYPYSYGHPGYNTRDGDGRILGNRDPSSSGIASAGITALPWQYDSLLPSESTAFLATIINFSHAGAGSSWTDAQALRHAIGISRAPFTPWFQVEDASAPDLLGTSNAWEVPVGMTLWELATQILDRRRGRGLAFFDWANDSGNPTGPLTYYLRVYNQNSQSVICQKPAARGTQTIHGAIFNNTDATVDLVGDHRNVASSFSLGDPHQHTYDYVETVGDQIQVLATLDYDQPSLEARWIAAEETAFAAITDPNKRNGTRWDSVFQLHGMPRSWDLMCGDGFGPADTRRRGRVDFRCRDDGSISVPAVGDIKDTAPNLITLLHDLPLFVGYTYAGPAPARYDSADENLAPCRRPPLALSRPVDLTVHDRYFRSEDYDQCSMHVSQYGVTIAHGSDLKDGLRFFSGVGSTTGGVKDKASVVLTVGLELPHRVRMADGNPLTGGRKQLIRLRGYALWLAHWGAIWDIPSDPSLIHDEGYEGLRAACNATAAVPGILRDDRDRLAAIHALASSWYRTTRRTATWALKACGFLPTFQTVASDGITTTDISYPTIGKCVTTLHAGGQSYTINTPITDVTYTASGNGVTTWTTDWADLNLQ